MKTTMKLGASVLGLVVANVAIADTLTYRNVVVSSGAIDGNDLTGQTATITIEFASGLTADGIVFHLGALSSATYEFSDAGLFSVDAPQDNLEFGSPGGFDLSFYDEDFDPLNMLSGSYAPNGFDPINGETLAAMFLRLGDGTNINYTQPGAFQMLNVPIGGLNGGSSFVTSNLIGAGGSRVTLTYIPAPAGFAALLGLAGVGTLRPRRH